MISEPTSFFDLIPDYVQGRLAPDITAAFVERLTVDQELRRELDEFLALRNLYRQTEVTQPPPSEAVFQRIEATINAAETSLTEQHHSSPLSSSKPWTHLQECWARLKPSFSIPWGLAIAQACLIVILLLPGQPDDSYQTLSSGSEVAIATSGPRFNIVFSESAFEADTRTLLLDTSATIVAGPSAEGRYVIVLPDDDNLQERVARLRRNEVVRFLEPVTD
jgi:hypothetical protein